MAALFLARTRNATLENGFEDCALPPDTVDSLLSSVPYPFLESWGSLRAVLVSERRPDTVLATVRERGGHCRLWSHASLLPPPLRLVMADEQGHIDLVLLLVRL